jgi:D-inositol-3-phosphate glycosyltransferase
MGADSSAGMHIAMLCVHSSPLARLGGKEAGGMNVYVRNLAWALGQQGCVVDIFTRAQDGLGARVVDLVAGVRVVYVAAGPLAPCDKYALLDYIGTFVQGVCDFAARAGMRYNLIHSHYWVSGVAALRLREAWDTPIVQMFHTLGVMKNQVARGDEHERDERVAIERGLLCEVDAVVAATPRDKAQMVQHYDADEARIMVLPCGVDLGRFRPQERGAARGRAALPQDKRILLGVGRMEPLKGLDVLIQAAHMLVAQQPAGGEPIQVLLVGGESEGNVGAWNSEQRRLGALRSALGMEQAVRFCGAQSHEYLPDYYAAADVVVVPSLYESFGLVALEAMACGAAVVASDVGGLSLTVEHGRSGVLVPPRQPGALARAIGPILTNAAWQAALGRGAREQALAYGWDNVARRIRTLYTRVVRNAGGESVGLCGCGLQERGVGLCGCGLQEHGGM